MYENFCIFIAQIYRTYLLCANFYILMNFNMILRMVSDVRMPLILFDVQYRIDYFTVEILYICDRAEHS